MTESEFLAAIVNLVDTSPHGDSYKNIFKIVEEKFIAERTLAGVAPTTTQGTKSAPEIVESNVVCLYCINIFPKKDCCGCHGYNNFMGRRLSPVA
jgi:hypothetical protein